ncbi:hypothetical protein CEXT_300711, partial [Caerostris extrusa]
PPVHSYRSIDTRFCSINRPLVAANFLHTNLE